MPNFRSCVKIHLQFPSISLWCWECGDAWIQQGVLRASWVETVVGEGNLPILCSKPTINPRLNLSSKIYRKRLLEESLPKCTCFWCRDSCNFRGGMFPVMLRGLRAQNQALSYRQSEASLFSAASWHSLKSLAFLGQTHLIDLEAPWPSEIRPLQLCSIITSFPGSLFSDPWPVSLCNGDGEELCYQYQVIYLYCPPGRERNDGFLVNLWSFKHAI